MWAAVVVALTLKVLRWHLDFYRTHGPEFYRVAPAFLIVLAAGAAVYAWIRGRLIWKIEPLAIATLMAAALLFYQPKATLLCALLFLACSSAGSFLQRIAGIKPDSALERLLVDFGFGAGSLVPALFVVGEAHLFYRSVFLGILIALLAAFHRSAIAVIADVRALQASWARSSAVRHPLVGVAIIVALLTMGLALLNVVSPVVAFDALDVHLPSVQRYVESHSISTIDQIDYSFFPQGCEVFWTLGYSVAGQAGVRAVSLIFFGMFLLTVVAIAKECFRNTATAVAAGVWCATFPFLNWTGSVVKNDMLMSFFQGLALYAFLRWLAARNFAWIAAGAFFMAQSFGVKHVALFGAIPLTLFFAYGAWKQPRRIRAAAITIVIFAISCGFWPLRTYWLKGNPAYPQVAQRTVQGGEAAHGHSIGDKIARYATLPWIITFDGRATFESVLPSPAGILLFALSPFVALSRPWSRGPAAKACLIFAVIYLIYWATILSIIRYAIVPIAILTIFAAEGCRLFYDEATWPAAMLNRVSLVGMEIYCLLIALLGSMVIDLNRPQLALLSGRIGEAAYLASVLDSYRSVEYLKKIAQPGESTFSVDNCSRAYAPNPLQFVCIKCSPGLCTMEEVSAEVRKQRSRYLILPSQGDYAGLWRDLNAEQMYHDEYFAVYRVP
jgi:hypothetical protein